MALRVGGIAHTAPRTPAAPARAARARTACGMPACGLLHRARELGDGPVPALDLLEQAALGGVERAGAVPRAPGARPRRTGGPTASRPRRQRHLRHRCSGRGRRVLRRRCRRAVADGHKIDRGLGRRRRRPQDPWPRRRHEDRRPSSATASRPTTSTHYPVHKQDQPGAHLGAQLIPFSGVSPGAAKPSTFDTASPRKRDEVARFGLAGGARPESAQSPGPAADQLLPGDRPLCIPGQCLSTGLASEMSEATMEAWLRVRRAFPWPQSPGRPVGASVRSLAAALLCADHTDAVPRSPQAPSEVAGTFFVYQSTNSRASQSV